MKYKKYFSKLQRAKINGKFETLSAKRKNFLIEKVNALRLKLSSMQSRLATAGGAAALMLTLSGTAQAQFVSNPSKNPFGQFTTLQSKVIYSGVTVKDLDNDGDNDMVISNNRELIYYKNTGTSSKPVFTEQTGTDDPFSGAVADYSYALLSLVDIDADGDFDLAAAGNIRGTYGQLSYFENTGSITNPVFTLQTGANNPMPVMADRIGYASVDFADLDNDGDKDLFVTDGKYGKLFYYENTGDASNPAFTLNTAGNPFPTGDFTNYGNYNYFPIAFADVDNDADLDVLITQKGGLPLFYENTGTVSAPVLTLKTIADNVFANSIFNRLSWNIPAFADMDGDGDYDLLTSSYFQTGLFYNTGTSSAPVFQAPLDFLNTSIPVFADLDGDGKEDLTIRTISNSNPEFYKNNGPVSSPTFTELTGTSNPLNAVMSSARNAFADIDQDSDLDLVTYDYGGGLHFYQNTGDATTPVYTELTGTSNPLNAYGDFNSPQPTFVDIDGDLDYDLVVGDYDQVYFYENTGTPTVPFFTSRTGTDNPIQLVPGAARNYNPAFSDVDGDGDQDLLLGTRENGLVYLENTGTAMAPVMTERSGTDDPFSAALDFRNQDISLTPGFTDIDGDGDEDLFVGSRLGYLMFFENTRVSVVTDVSTPVSVAFSGSVNAYPNPVKDQLNIALSDAIGASVNVSILDLGGKEVSSKQFENSGDPISLNVEGLRAGMYMIKVTSEKKAGIAKFVKQ